MTAPLQTTAPRRSPVAPARRVAATVFAAQGAAMAAVSTTVPAVKELLALSSQLMTVLVVGVALSAGAGSFAGLGVIRRLGLVAAMRTAVVATAAALLLIGWAPGRTAVAVSYGLFGMALGCIDVSANTRAAAVERHARMNVFNYTGVLAGGAVSGTLGSTGHFGLAYAIPAALVLTLVATARLFDKQVPAADRA
ncbi:MFS transporter [Streptomyces shenzhenensis]|uniref:hypothetical protein n=1 Tax=Streptomyces shenzhenensis TaxID=943815 RepID=UPI0015F08952|nr:hypothetical protein [Streptomyces shenzhenensis]